MVASLRVGFKVQVRPPKFLGVQGCLDLWPSKAWSVVLEHNGRYQVFKHLGTAAKPANDGTSHSNLS